MESPWADQVKNAIDEIGDPDEDPFVGTDRLKIIWADVLHDAHADRRSDSSLCQCIQGILRDRLDDDRHFLLITATILVLVDWSGWENFHTIFIDDGRPRYPLPMSQSVALQIPQVKSWRKFRQAQSMFVSRIIKKDEDNLFQQSEKLPFVEPEKPMKDQGAQGIVTKIKIAPGYFESDGRLNARAEILARKKFIDQAPFKQELAILKELRKSIVNHERILPHLCTMQIQNGSFSILSQYADGGNLDGLLHTPLDTFVQYRWKILDEMALLASAISFLHEGFLIDGKHTPCYHLDLKPQNIVIFREAGNPIGQWKVIDFGLSELQKAIRQTSNTGSKSVSTPRRAEGTFQPPEIKTLPDVELAKVQDKGDIWSFGGIVCVILAFYFGGSDGVRRFEQTRDFHAIGKSSLDCYYVLKGEGTALRAEVHPKVAVWIREIGDHWKSDQRVWATAMVEFIFSCLNVNPSQRVNAKVMSERLYKIGSPERRKERTRSRDDTRDPVHMPLRERVTGIPADSTVSTNRSLAGSLNTGLSPVSTRRTRPTDDGGTPITSPTSAGSAGLMIKNISEKKHLGLQGIKSSPVLHGIGPNAEYIWVCHTDQVLLYANQSQPSRPSDFGSRQEPIMGEYPYVFPVGPFLAMFQKNSHSPHLASVSKSNNPASARLINERMMWKNVTSVAVSTGGVVAAMTSDSVYVADPQIGLPPTQRFKVDWKVQGEYLRTIHFDQDCRTLWACGVKTWFRWKVEDTSMDWIKSPTHGPLHLHVDDASFAPLLFCLKSGVEFLWYSSKAGRLQLYNVGDRTKFHEINISMVCCALSPREDQLFYVKKANSGFPQRSTYELCSRFVRGTIGEEKHRTHLAELKPKPKAPLQMAYRQHETKDELVIVSLQGTYVCAELSSDQDTALRRRSAHTD